MGKSKKNEIPVDPFAGQRFRLVNRESGSGDQTYPSDIWLVGATRADIKAGMDVKAAYAKAIAHWREQGRLARLEARHAK